MPKKTDRPLTANVHVDGARWDFRRTTRGITMAMGVRVGLPLNYVKGLHPVGQKVATGREITCEIGFQPTPRLALEDALGQGARQGVSPSLEKAWEVLGK
jgi:hypothetical protein